MGKIWKHVFEEIVSKSYPNDGVVPTELLRGFFFDTLSIHFLQPKNKEMVK